MPRFAGFPPATLKFLKELDGFIERKSIVFPSASQDVFCS